MVSEQLGRDANSDADRTLSSSCDKSAGGGLTRGPDSDPDQGCAYPQEGGGG